MGLRELSLSEKTRRAHLETECSVAGAPGRGVWRAEAAEVAGLTSKVHGGQARWLGFHTKVLNRE